MRIFVTGGCGFIGSNFIRFLLKNEKKAIIVNIDKQTYAGRGRNIEHMGLEKSRRYTFFREDILNRQFIDEVFSELRPEIAFNFAAESHVDRSIENATPFRETNVIGTGILLEAAKKSRIERFVQISCYDEKTRALTTNGLKTYKELREGDCVFSLNPITQEIEVKPIEKIIIQPYEGQMIHFNNKRIDLMVTPNHKMFILNTSKKAKKLLIETAEKASKRSIFYMPEGQWTGKKEEYFEVKGYGRVKTKDLMYILGIFIGDGFIAYQEKRIETKTGLAREEYLEKSRDKLNGKFKKIEKIGNHISISKGYRIFFDIPVNDKCRKKVEKTLSNLGIKYHCHEGKAGSHLYFTSKAFMEFFTQCGQGAHNKHIPRWALEYSSEYLACLFEGLMDSDGYGGKIYYTVSEMLASDICELCIKLNLKPSMHKRYSISSLNGRRIEGISYYIFIAKTVRSISHHRNKVIDYKGHIWCLKVKDNKNFLVERNGRFDFCGNTDEIYGSIEKGSFDEDSRLNPSNPYAESKADAEKLARKYFEEHHLPVIITRSANNYGPYQFPEKLLPLFITNLIEGKKVPLMHSRENPGLNVRDWLHVEDNCRAIWFIAQKGKEGEAYNIPGENEKTNIEVTHMLLENFRYGRDMINYVEHRKAHDFRYSIDGRKLEEMGFEHKHKDFEKGLEETVRWYRQNENWWRPLKK